ncbi:MAG: flagellar hook-associated protein FlgK [Alphaproteobacteria bacterium]|nr:flagellar hook-associated protein FlgK [Alphaproteobacteria bacterium]
MALINGLSTSLTGMKAAQSQLDIISRNISNVDTKGYTRKTAGQVNTVLNGVPLGVNVAQSQRIVDEGLLKSYLATNSLSNNLSSKYDFLSKAEVMLGTPQGNNSISANISTLQSAFDTFANDITSSSSKYNLLNQATAVTNRLNELSTGIQSLRGQADTQIAADVEKINTLLDNLDKLNDEVVKYNIMGYDGGADMEDKRDQALRDLSQYIDISYFKRESGAIVVQTTGGITLLDNDPHKLSHNGVAMTNPTTTYANGGIGGIYVDNKDITQAIKGGELKGLIEIRDETLSSLQTQLDELSATLKNQINIAHNSGTAYPNTPDKLVGTRTFIQNKNNPALDTYPQSISIEDGDVRLSIFDAEGKQVASTTLVDELKFSNGSISDLTETIQNWLNSPTGANLPQAEVYISAEGKMIMDTGDTNYGISIFDQATSTAGAEQKNATIRFDNNADGNYDMTTEGFSNFFGLNDFFVDNGAVSTYDSKVMPLNANMGINDISIISFSDSVNGLNFGTITVTPNDSLSDIVEAINTNPSFKGTIRASLFPNGNGYVLRIEDLSGAQLEISEVQGDNLLGHLGLEPSNAGLAMEIDVREDIKTSPDLISGGVPVYSSETGKYSLNAAANDVAVVMSKAFNNSYNFKQSGTIARTQTTLANYAATFVGNIASQTSNAEASFQYQTELSNSIATKEAKLSGVDLDEELGQMIIFQQTYAACAQAFTASKEILDMLLDIV